MRDNDIIKALEHCSDNESGSRDCCECPCYAVGNMCCETDLHEYALDLINRQKAENKKLKQAINNFKKSKEIHRAEIESLNHDVEVLYRVKEQLKGMYKTAKTEAIKEFVGRLKETMAITFERVDGSRGYQTEDYFIDNLVEEMTEGGE